VELKLQHLAFGGTTGTNTGATEEYNGTSWTTSPGSMNTARQALAGAGTQTAGLAFGGITAPTIRSETEQYDGTSWTNTTSMTTAKREPGGAGTQALALAFGGFSPSTPASAATEEFTITGTKGIKTITVS
jgi:hypothetical protein